MNNFAPGRILEVENRCEQIKRKNRDLENQNLSCEESIKVL